jgi:hypothetical protein
MYHSHATHVHRQEMGVLVEMILAVASYQVSLSIRCQLLLRCQQIKFSPTHTAPLLTEDSSKGHHQNHRTHTLYQSVAYPIIIALFIIVAHSHTIASFIHLS